MLAFLAWWLCIQLFGLAGLPLTRRVFAWLPGGGYAFSKPVGLLLVSYLLWLGASAGLWANNTAGILIALLLVAGLSLAVNLRGGLTALRARAAAFWQADWRSILVVEGLFLLAFGGWTLVRAYAPDKIMPMSGEKFMEIAFLNGVLNSPHFPPLDPWLSGYTISYYYFGYVMMGVMTRLTGVLPTMGFDLYDALLFGLTALSAYGVVQASGGTPRGARAAGLLGALFVGGMGNLEGLLEGLYASRALPQAFWRWLNIPDLAGSLQSGSFYPGSGWWWWRASRVIMDLDLFHQPLPVQPIDEFPAFSFLLGDNHPHKLALPFVLLAIGLALNLFLRQIQQPASRGGRRGWIQPWRLGLFLFYALVLGGLAFLNTWDFPIYLALVLLAYALGTYLAQGRLTLSLLASCAALGAGLGATAVLLYGFFYASFTSQAGGVLPYVFPPTRLPQYLVMFGPFIVILALFLFHSARQSGKPFPVRPVLTAWAYITGLAYGVYLLALLAGVLLITASNAPLGASLKAVFGGLTIGEGVARILLDRLTQPWLFLALSALLALAVTALLRRPNQAAAPPEAAPPEAAPPETASPETASPEAASPETAPLEAAPDAAVGRLPVERFALLLALCGFGLTLLVEFFYLRDNFGVRMNTLFKFYYQAWVMLACASAYAVWWLDRAARGTSRRIFEVVTVLMVAAGLVYPIMGIASRTDAFKLSPNLDGAATFAGLYPQSDTYSWAAHPDDWAAIQWLRAHGRLPDGSVPTILEAGSQGYENAGRISAFTGYPTLLGWTNHEGQWRGSQEQINVRTPIIQAIFTGYDAGQALDMLHQWHVRYVIVGDTERDYVARLCQEPARACSAPRALEKFAQTLTPVFTQGGTTIYSVPR